MSISLLRELAYNNTPNPRDVKRQSRLNMVSFKAFFIFFKIHPLFSLFIVNIVLFISDNVKLSDINKCLK